MTYCRTLFAESGLMWGGQRRQPGILAGVHPSSLVPSAQLTAFPKETFAGNAWLAVVETESSINFLV